MRRTALALVAAAGLATSSLAGIGPGQLETGRTVPGADVAEALAAAPARTAGLLPALGPTLEGFRLVGHSPLNSRGMNAALAIHDAGDAGAFAYVGSRTDGKADNATGAGVLVVDISDPSDPTVVNEIGPPHQGLSGQTSRELRVWPEQDLLIVMNLGSNCSELIHACSPLKVTDTFDFYDISDPANPEHVSLHDPLQNPHEFHLWVDPEDPQRALLWVSGTASDTFYALDISRWREGVFTELALANVPYQGGSLHSMTPTFDGRETHFANLTGGFAVVDTSDLAEGVPDPEFRPLTNPATAPTWPGEGAHSSVPLPGMDVALVTDEVYGDALAALGDHGCPWGWARFIDTSNAAAPTVVGEWRLPVQEEEFCATDAPRPSSSYSAHNPTVTDRLAFISWHAGGLRVLDFSDPTDPVQTGAFIPEPLPAVATEDPALTAGQDKVAFWSFPIIHDGLVYVVDIRNGLYVLEYTGEPGPGNGNAPDPQAVRVGNIDFLEGNSNVGDARLLPAHGAPDDATDGDG